MNSTEKTSYVKALVYIALADDTIGEGEERYLDQIGDLYGLSDVEIAEIKRSIKEKQEPIEDILSSISERTTKLTLLYDLAALCYADESYSIVEKQGLERICDIMGIETEKLSAIEAVMAEQLELQKKINVILER